MDTIRKHVVLYKDELAKYEWWRGRLGFSLSEFIRRGANILVSILEIIAYTKDKEEARIQLYDFVNGLIEYYGERL